MSSDTVTSRRSFLKAGALVAPIALAVTPAVGLAGDGGAARLARLEDEAAIRALHRAWLRTANGAGSAPLLAAQEGAVCGIADDPASEAETIAISSDGGRASARFGCLLEIETGFTQDSTFERMAHAPGNGAYRSSRRGVLAADYVRSSDGWTLATIRFELG